MPWWVEQPAALLGERHARRHPRLHAVSLSATNGSAVRSRVARSDRWAPHWGALLILATQPLAGLPKYYEGCPRKAAGLPSITRAGKALRPFLSGNHLDKQSQKILDGLRRYGDGQRSRPEEVTEAATRCFRARTSRSGERYRERHRTT